MTDGETASMQWAAVALLVALYLLLWGRVIRLGVLVAKDANRIGMRGWAWGLFVICSWWFALLVYRHVRGPGPLRLKDDG